MIGANEIDEMSIKMRTSGLMTCATVRQQRNVTKMATYERTSSRGRIVPLSSTNRTQAYEIIHFTLGLVYGENYELRSL